jgi:glyoxylase-like metal-dependent hydrolase (beta-lactamase superfamily II)
VGHYSVRLQVVSSWRRRRRDLAGPTPLAGSLLSLVANIAVHRSSFHSSRKENSMKAITQVTYAYLAVLPVLACACASSRAIGDADKPARPVVTPRVARAAPYADMPAIAPIGVRIDKYLDVPELAKGPPIDPAKGYRIQALGDGLYMVTDNGYQSMFMTYEDGVVVIDAPTSYASHIRTAIAEVTDKPITHIIYSHFHADHIGGTRTIGGAPIIIAQAETKRLLARDNDPDRPLPTVTFDHEYKLSVGSQTLELSYHNAAHAPGNIFIYAPKQRTLMIVDVVFPGWMPWRRFALAQDIPAYFAQVKEIASWDFDTLVGGHVARTGTHEDVATQLAFMEDVKAAAAEGLKITTAGEGLNPADHDNWWAVYDDYIDRVVVHCMNQVTPKWSRKLGGYDAFVWDQCYAMEQSLRID